MKKLFFLFLLALNSLLFSQVIIKLQVPNNTPNNATIYLTGDINYWNPNHENYKFSKNSDGIYELTLNNTFGNLQYKITRGSWEREEATITGGFIANRNLTFLTTPQTITLTIEGWKDLAGSTASKNVQILNSTFETQQLNTNRKIWLYLPPDYQTSTKKYPVIYMHDAQNIFDIKTSFSGEWEVDESLNNLFSQGDYGVIVVGIDNGGSTRLNEYSPWKNPTYNAGGDADKYLQFIVETLKPFIDANYRTKIDFKNTGLIGSSMGGLVSLYGGVKYPNVFGKIGSASPAYWFVINELQNYIDSKLDLSNLKIYHVTGKNESSTMILNVLKIEEKVKQKGVLNINSKVKIDDDGTHSEPYWKREFSAMYKWLFQEDDLNIIEESSKKK
jgi:predicted alpha/beta superfamily hydrolase